LRFEQFQALFHQLKFLRQLLIISGLRRIGGLPHLGRYGFFDRLFVRSVIGGDCRSGVRH
jgi:hypothetical protein